MNSSNTSSGHLPGRRLKTQLIKNALKTHPWIALRIIIVWAVLSPWFIVSLILSSIKSKRWSKPNKCRDFLKKNSAAFKDVDPDSLTLDSLSGGVSNSNYLWHCKKNNGQPVTYFVKAFVPVGTFWAMNLSLVSPFPAVKAMSSRQRFTADFESRVFLSGQGISVPKLVAMDSDEQLLVTEFIEGQNMDKVLQQAALQESLSPQQEELIQECGTTLGKIHRTGYSLVDTQPINCICAAKEKTVYFTDLEFCTKEDKKNWDAAFFLCFLSIRLPETSKKKARDLFMEAYSKQSSLNRQQLEIIEAGMKDFIPVFQTILEVRQYKPDELFAEVLNPAG